LDISLTKLLGRRTRAHLVGGEDKVALPFICPFQENFIVRIHHLVIDVEGSSRLYGKIEALDSSSGQIRMGEDVGLTHFLPQPVNIGVIA